MVWKHIQDITQIFQIEQYKMALLPFILQWFVSENLSVGKICQLGWQIIEDFSHPYEM